MDDFSRLWIAKILIWRANCLNFSEELPVIAGQDEEIKKAPET